MLADGKLQIQYEGRLIYTISYEYLSFKGLGEIEAAISGLFHTADYHTIAIKFSQIDAI